MAIVHSGVSDATSATLNGGTDGKFLSIVGDFKDPNGDPSRGQSRGRVFFQVVIEDPGTVFTDYDIVVPFFEGIIDENSWIELPIADATNYKVVVENCTSVTVEVNT